MSDLESRIRILYLSLKQNIEVCFLPSWSPGPSVLQLCASSAPRGGTSTGRGNLPGLGDASMQGEVPSHTGFAAKHQLKRGLWEELDGAKDIPRLFRA